MDSAPESGRPHAEGRIPFTFRIGVTGHRELGGVDDLQQPIREAISRLLTLVPVAPGAGLALVVVSALAEGADRLVAEEVLAASADRLILETAPAYLDARLEVALPLDAKEYAEDFKTEESKEEFRGLLGRARAGDVWQAPAGLDRDEAYERAGRYVIDRCDALIAVWDGEKSRGRGGTADIVGYAQEHGVPIAWVHSAGGAPVSYALENKRAAVVGAAAGKLRKYNAAKIETSRFDQRVRELRAELMPDIAREIPVDPLGLSRETIADWVFPYFVRADILALRYQQWFRWLSLAIFALAALAVAVVAVQTNFWPKLNWLAAFEVVFLGILLGILIMNRRLRLHDQWISSRFLAERARSGYFLALAGTGDRRGRSARLAYLSDSSEAWIERALTEVSARRPELDAGPPLVSALRDYLNRYWIESQIAYQEKTSGRQHAFESRLIRLTESLFSLTLVAAFIHIFASTIHGVWEGLLVVVSITVPAFGAAVHGFSTQRQFRRHSERYRRMAGVLTQVQAEMTDATTIEQVREAAAATEQVMREENSDWFGVMRFHDMELIT
jgi:SMODS and SLOG-associating 2TM effector domain 1